MSFPPRRTRTQPRFFRALPAYLGGKRRLCPLIFSLIADELPRAEWPGSTLLDPFSGGGSVALFAKAQGFSVVASDIAERAAVVTRAVVANSSVRLRREDVLDLFREPDGSYPRIAARQVPLVFSAAGVQRRSGPVARPRRGGRAPTVRADPQPPATRRDQGGAALPADVEAHGE